VEEHHAEGEDVALGEVDLASKLTLLSAFYFQAGNRTQLLRGIV
jgi:hypothetical protein